MTVVMSKQENVSFGPEVCWRIPIHWRLFLLLSFSFNLVLFLCFFLNKTFCIQLFLYMSTKVSFCVQLFAKYIFFLITTISSMWRGHMMMISVLSYTSCPTTVLKRFLSVSEDSFWTRARFSSCSQLFLPVSKCFLLQNLSDVFLTFIWEMN